MRHPDFVPKYLAGEGIEIGAFKTPIPGIKPVYIDLFKNYAGEPTLVDYEGEACRLPYHDSSLDYVASSHVLEHVANPVAALCEWYRVLRHRGVIYMVVPDRRRTFDHTRPLTAVEHMLEDYHKGTTPCDGTHLQEFTYQVDPSMFFPSLAPDAVKAQQDSDYFRYTWAIDHNLPVNIHFHTFELENLRALIDAVNTAGLVEGCIEIIDTAQDFPDDCPNGVLVVCRIHKSITERIRSLVSRKGLLPGTKAPVLS